MDNSVAEAERRSSTNAGERFLTKVFGDMGKDDDGETIKQLLAHVPNNLVYFDYKKDMPAIKEFLGIVLFADISGFTKLTERYSTMETSDGTSGIDKLSATLNDYIGMIVEEIIQRNGDVLKFAGDAILATWRCSDIGHNAKSLLNKVINCSIDIQNNCDNFETDVGIVLRVKLAIAIGPMCLTYFGLPEVKQFDLSGSAVDAVGITEKQATPGAIIVSQLAWANCDQTLFSIESMKDEQYFKVLGRSHLGPNSGDNKSSTKKNTAGLLQTTKKRITSPLDDLISEVTYYKQDMPKALLLDEDEKITAGRYLTQTVITGNHVGEKKKKKFDRKTMVSDLEASEIENLRAYVPEPVLYKLDHGENLEWLSEMRQVSVLFINMKLPDPAKEAGEALQKAFEVVYESCTKYRGNINKVFGFDKGCTFVVIFGLPGQKHEDGPVRAMKCALAIFDSLHSIPEIINESIGVTTGLAFTGVVGHKDRQEYTVIGSKVNMAARLMTYYPGILTCDAETYEASISRLRKQDFIAMPYIELKGLKDHGIVREYNPHSSKKDDEDDFDFPILGRKDELEKFRELLTSDSLSSTVVVVEGEPGIGKTRLLEQVMDDAEVSGKRVVHIEGDLTNSQASGHVKNSIVKLLLDEDGKEQERILSLVENDEDVVEHLHLLSDIFNINTSTTSIHTMEGGDFERLNERKSVLYKILKKICEQQGCVFVIDSARYVDEKSWSFLYDLIETLPQSLFVFGVRKISSLSSSLCVEALDVFKSHKAYRMRIAGLEREYIVDFVCQLLRVAEAPKKLCDLIAVKSQGVPSWCEQLVKDVLYANTVQILARSAILPLSKQRLSKLEMPIINVADHPTAEEMDHKRMSIVSRRPEAQSRIFIPTSKLSFTDGSTFTYDENDYLRASPGVVPEETDEICIVTPGADLNSLIVPDSVKDMVLARMDRMTLTEQTVLKCAAVLGQSFTRDLLKAIIPKNNVNMIDTTLYNLCKQQFFECGSLVLQLSHTRSQSSYLMFGKHSSLHHQQQQQQQQQHHHHHHNHVVQGVHSMQVLCACYAFEGFSLINLSQSNNFMDKKKRVCLYFHFTNTFVQEAAYALWLEDQRRAIYEKATQYLEKSYDKCRACGGSGFIPGHGRGVSVTQQLKNGSAKRFSVSISSQVSRSSRAFSGMISNVGGSSGVGMMTKPASCIDGVHEESARIFKNTKAEHIRNYVVEGSRGEGIGLVLVEMARVFAQSKEASNENQQKSFRKLGKQNSRVHPTTIGKMAARTLLMEFGKCPLVAEVLDTDDQQQKGLAETLDIDLSQCQCAMLHATTLPQLVFYCKASGNLMKAFHYMLDAAAATIDVNNHIKAISLLNKIDDVIQQQEKREFKDFIISDEERARVEYLRGQALCNMGCIDEGITHFCNALGLMNAPQPTNQLGILTRTWKASLVQTLHQKMPGVFTENRREESNISVEQIRCLSHLSKAYTLKKDYNRAYLANLEQLNSVEEASDNYWNELMTAYTDMIVSCIVFRKFNAGKSYVQLAIETSKLASLNVDDMLTLAKLHQTLVSFHLVNGDINVALDAALKCQRVAKSINDLHMKISIIPLLVQIYLLKLRTQSCHELLLEYKELMSAIDDRNLKCVYLCCCLDHMLDAGESVEEISQIVEFISTTGGGGMDGFHLNYLKTGVTLWYARQSAETLVEQFWDYWPLPEVSSNDLYVKYEIFLWRLLAARTECALHYHRYRPSISSRIDLQFILKTFQNTIKGKGLFQARLYHYQAYYAYLRKKTNRAKLLLEDCNVASKNNDVGFDLEWAIASRSTWFIDKWDLIDPEIQYSGIIKFILPRSTD